MKLATLIVGVPVAAAAVTFAVGNRGPVGLDLWPLPFLPEVPVYVAVLTPFVLGFVVGGVISWITAGTRRARIRAQARDIARLQRELALKDSELAEARKAEEADAETPEDRKMISAA